MIVIDLSKPETRLCRDAAKLGKSGTFVSHGETVLPRGDWSDLAKWLSWVFVDIEGVQSKEDRHAAEKLSYKIEAAIARHDKARAIVLAETVTEPEPVETPAGCLF